MIGRETENMGDEEISERQREEKLILYYTICYSIVMQVRQHYSYIVKIFTIRSPGN